MSVEKQKDLPKGWVECELGKILSLKNGFAFKSNLFQDEGLPVIRISNINEGKVEIKGAKCISEESRVDNFLIQKGDVLIAMSGATTGKYGIYIEDHPAYQNQRVGNFIPHTSDIDRRFIYYLLGSLKGEIEEKAYGAAQPNISSKMIEELSIFLPPLAEQKRIVAKLDAFMEQIAEAKKGLQSLPQLLKDFRQSVLSQAVTGKLTQEWREGKDLGDAMLEMSKFLDERKQKDKAKKVQDLRIENIEGDYQIPNSWEYGYLQYFGEFTRGKSKHRPRNDHKLFGGEYPFIQTGDVANSGGFITNYTNTYSEFGLKQSRLFPKGTLCITIAANIAETGILEFDSCFPDSVVGYIPYDNFYSSKFAMYFINTIQKDLEHYAPATAQKNINMKILSEIPFPVPTFEEREEIVRKVEALFLQADAIESQYKALKEKVETLPQAILAKAFRGELVAQDSADEPASVLLAKITALRESLGGKKKK